MLLSKARRHILGVPVDIIDGETSLSLVNSLMQDNKLGNYILAVNAEKVISLQKNIVLKNFYEKASLLLTDGIGVVIAIRLILGMKANRVTGIDLMQSICKQSLKYKYRIFVFGGREEINKKAIEILKMRFPGIQIVGRSNGYVNDEEMGNLLTQINEADADILFVGLGSPKQEMWILNNLASLKIRVCQAIGGTLDVLAGKSKRAPYLIQMIGFEWLYRLLKEPKRIGRQVVYPLFIYRIFKEKLRIHLNG